MWLCAVRGLYIQSVSPRLQKQIHLYFERDEIDLIPAITMALKSHPRVINK